MDPFRALYVVWGALVLVLFAYVLVKRWRGFRYHRDNRARRDLMEGIALFFVAAPAAAAIFAFLMSPDARPGAAILSATALGAFVGVGILMATEQTAR